MQHDRTFAYYWDMLMRRHLLLVGVFCGVTALVFLVGSRQRPQYQASATLLLSLDGTTVYDTVNNVTWLANANLAATDRFGLSICKGSGPQPCVNPSGSMGYQAAAAWVNAMNAANYLGHTNWQLPTTPTNDSGCGKTGPTGGNFGFGCTVSAFGSLWNALGLKAPNTAVAIPQQHGRAIQQFPTLSLLVAVGRSSSRRQFHFFVRHRLAGRQHAA